MLNKSTIKKTCYLLDSQKTINDNKCFLLKEKFLSTYNIVLIVIIVFASYGILCGQNLPKIQAGFLDVASEPTGINIYINDTCIGKTPIIDYRLDSGEYTVSVFPSLTYISKTARINTGKANTIAIKLPELSYLIAGTKEIEIKTNEKTTVFFQMKTIEDMPNKVKRTVIYSSGALLLLGFLLGALIVN